MKKLLALTIGTALGSFSAAHAAFEEIGVSARVTGMGNAFTAVADDVYSVYYNPAGLGTLDRPEFATSYSKLFTGLSDSSNLQNSFLAYAHPLNEGRAGAYALAWNYLTLDSLYRETSLYGSYGRALFAESHPDKFFAGLSFKYLSRSLGTVGVASQALSDTGVSTGLADPVLKNTTRGNIDLDLGFLYRVRPRWTLGLMMSHLMEPNVAFSSADTDKLGRNYKLGLSYKTPFSTLAADLALRKSPEGATDKVFSLGTEKWLPTLAHGTFGLRAALGVGSHDYRQLSAGLSYKIYRMQLDYGFAIPLGGLAGTAGTHRMGLTFRFGRPRHAEPTIAEALLEGVPEIADAGSPEYRFQAQDIAQFRRVAIEEFLRQAKVETLAGRFALAEEKLAQALSLSPADPKLGESRGRLKIVAALWPEVKDFEVEAASAALYKGLVEYLNGSDQSALGHVASAQALSPNDERVASFKGVLEAKLGVASVPAPAAPVVATPSVPAPAVTAAPEVSTGAATERIVAGNLALVEVALMEGKYDKVLKLAAQVIELDASNVQAYKRMASAYYALKRYPEELDALNKAYALETDPIAKAGLQNFIAELKAQMARTAAPAKVAAPKPAKTPQEIERLYEAGVDLYARGKLPEAAAVFRRILEADPNNAQAKRALERIMTELPQGAPKK